MKKKVVCIVQARMGSNRLPGKVMMPVLGMPMISYTLNRLARCKCIDVIVLATSDLDSDSELAAYGRSIGVECFRGSEDDVLERYVLANRKYGGDIVVRVTGDCPLIDPEIVDLAINEYLTGNFDYACVDVNSAMRGIDTEVFSADALERTYRIVGELEDFKNYKEHVTIYMYTHTEQFSIKRIFVGEDLSRPYRLCVDEIDDFRVIEHIYNHFKSAYPSIWEVVEFLDCHPEIAGLNKSVVQK